MARVRANLCKPKNGTGSSTEPHNQRRESVMQGFNPENNKFLPRKKMEISKTAVRVTFPNIKADPLRAAQSVPGV